VFFYLKKPEIEPVGGRKKFRKMGWKCGGVCGILLTIQIFLLCRTATAGFGRVEESGASNQKMRWKYGNFKYKSNDQERYSERLGNCFGG